MRPVSNNTNPPKPITRVSRYNRHRGQRLLVTAAILRSAQLPPNGDKRALLFHGRGWTGKPSETVEAHLDNLKNINGNGVGAWQRRQRVN